MGIFTHYYQWIASFSDKIHQLVQTDSFPLSSAAIGAFKNLRRDIANSAVTAIDPAIPLVVKIDASDISANLVIQCLCSLFVIFGVSVYIHSDCGASFMSEQLKQFLWERGVAT